MSEHIRGKGPAVQVRKGSAEDYRRARLDDALRANLKRRKAQARGRDNDDGDNTAEPTRDTPAIFKSSGEHNDA